MMPRMKAAVAALALLAGALAGCGALQLTNAFNPEFLNSLGLTTKVATLPGQAPGVLVAVENRTGLTAQMIISYRDPNDAVQTYTTTLGAGEKSAQLLPCPVKEITLGDVANLQGTGAVVYLQEPPTGGSLTGVPYVAVEPFGSLLRDTINYDCGDGLTFTVQPSGSSRSGFQTFVYVYRSGAQ